MTAIFGTLAIFYFVAAVALSGATIAAGARNNAGRTGFTPTMLVR